MSDLAKRYKHKPVEFIEGCLRLPLGGPLKLSPVQKLILREAMARPWGRAWKYKQIALLHSKGSGKTTLAGALLVHRLMCWPMSLSCVLSQSEQQAINVLFRTAREIAGASFGGLDLGAGEIRNPNNGARIIALPRSYRSCEGVRVRHGLLAVDELHRFAAEPDTVLDELGSPLDLMIAQTECPESQIILCGQIGMADSYAARVKDLWERGESPRTFVDYRTDAAEVNPTHYDTELREAARKTLPPYIYKVLHECAPAESSSNVLDPAWLTAAQARGADLGLSSPVTREEFQRIQSSYGACWVTAGLDRALSLTAAADRTVTVLLARPIVGPLGAAPVFLLACHVFPVGHGADDILRALLVYAERYGGVRALAADRYQTVDLRLALLRALHIPEKRCSFVAESGQWQLSAFGAVGELLQQDRLVLGVGDGTNYLVKELSRLRAVLSRDLTGARFAAAAGRDDSAHALALATVAMAGLREHDSGQETADEARGRYEALTRYEVTGDGYDLARCEHERYNAARRERRWARHTTPRHTERWGSE